METVKTEETLDQNEATYKTQPVYRTTPPIDKYWVFENLCEAKEKQFDENFSKINYCLELKKTEELFVLFAENCKKLYEINQLLHKTEDEIYFKLSELLRGESFKKEDISLRSHKDFVKNNLLVEEDKKAYDLYFNTFIEELHTIILKTNNIPLRFLSKFDIK